MKNICCSEVFIALIICLCICFLSWLSENSSIKIEHEKTIQKAIECGYEPISIGGDYWNKGD